MEKINMKVIMQEVVQKIFPQLNKQGFQGKPTELKRFDKDHRIYLSIYGNHPANGTLILLATSIPKLGDFDEDFALRHLSMYLPRVKVTEIFIQEGILPPLHHRFPQDGERGYHFYDYKNKPLKQIIDEINGLYSTAVKWAEKYTLLDMRDDLNLAIDRNRLNDYDYVYLVAKCLVELAMGDLDAAREIRAFVKEQKKRKYINQIDKLFKAVK